MNPFNRIADHHAKNIYKRGAFKGDAPVAWRGKTHFRSIKNSDGTYAVRFHKTDILTIHPIGIVVINCDGYVDRTPTTIHLNIALGEFVSTRAHVQGKATVMGYAQPILNTDTAHQAGTKYRYYDGMIISVNDDTGHVNVHSTLQVLKRRRIHKEKVAAFTAAIDESGFKDAFKIMHAVSEPMTGLPRVYPTSHRNNPPLADQLADNKYSEYWAQVISAHAHDMYFNYQQGVSATRKRDAAATWANIMAAAKKTMYEVVDSDVTSIST
jgi:hypothetical protein